MPRCLPSSLRSVQLPLDHLVEMRDRAVCHQRRKTLLHKWHFSTAWYGTAWYGSLLGGFSTGYSTRYLLHFIWKSRSQSLEEEWRGTESMLLEVQCEVSTVSDDLGCHVICWCWPTVFSEVHSQSSHLTRNFRAFHASFC